MGLKGLPSCLFCWFSYNIKDHLHFTASIGITSIKPCPLNTAHGLSWVNLWSNSKNKLTIFAILSLSKDWSIISTRINIFAEISLLLWHFIKISSHLLIVKYQKTFLIHTITQANLSILRSSNIPAFFEWDAGAANTLKSESPDWPGCSSSLNKFSGRWHCFQYQQDWILFTPTMPGTGNWKSNECYWTLRKPLRNTSEP